MQLSGDGGGVAAELLDGLERSQVERRPSRSIQQDRRISVKSLVKWPTRGWHPRMDKTRAINSWRGTVVVSGVGMANDEAHFPQLT